MMLDPVALKSLGAAVVHVNRQSYGEGPLRVHQPVPIVLIDVQVVRDDLKLIAGHSKYVVVVNVHEKRQEP